MVRLCLVLLALGAFGAPAADAGEVKKSSFASKLLGRDYNYSVYLPDGYDGGSQTYPVVYLLHGASGDETHWPDRGNIKAVMDDLIATGKIKPMVVIMPGHKGAWWVDGAAEPAESVLLKELMPHAETKYRVAKEASARAVAGLSAGGYGSVRLILRHPEMFAAAAALSPAVYVPEPPADSSAMKDHAFQKNGKFDKKLWQDLNWPSYFDAYRAQPLRVPLYVNSGDHDRFGIAAQAASMFDSFWRVQPDKVEFRVVDGDHDWKVWSTTIGDAMVYMSNHMTGPTGS